MKSCVEAKEKPFNAIIYGRKGFCPMEAVHKIWCMKQTQGIQICFTQSSSAFVCYILDHHQRFHWIKSFVDKKEKRRQQQTASEGHWSNLFMTWTAYTFQFFIPPAVHLHSTTWGGNTWQRQFMSPVNHGTIFSFKP